MNWIAFILLSALWVTNCLADPFELTGRLGYEQRMFMHDALYDKQAGQHHASIFIEPELFWQDGDSNSLVVKPYIRLDQHDSKRSHFDIREFMWTHAADDWELKSGIGKVFWGVTEFQHLTDVINQTDAIEEIDGEEKLGQLMINLSVIRDWGTIDLFLLPGFREPTFAGSNGRLRAAWLVDTDNSQYESGAEDKHLDTAIRWSHTLSDYDFGLYWFHGTNRAPVFSLSDDKLIPFYQQMDQFGLDLQATIDGWLWKLEAIYRDTQTDNYAAIQGGFEYTFVGIFNTALDLGILSEYGWDQRGEGAGVAMQNDVFAGVRLGFNDMQSSEILIGIGQDFDHTSSRFILEANRRIAEDWTLGVDIRILNTTEVSDPIYALRKDDYVQITLERYF